MIKNKKYLLSIIFVIFYTPQKLYASHFNQLSPKDQAYVLHDLLLKRDTESLHRLRQLLIRYPGHIDATNAREYSLLQNAVLHNYREGVELLLLLGANVNFIHPTTGDTALHFSTDPEITQMLVSHPEILINARNYDQMTPLLTRVGDYHDLTAENIHILLTAGAKANAFNNERFTALHLLFNARHPSYINASISERQQLNAIILDVLKDLVDHGAKVNARSADGLTPLHFAAKMNHPPIVKFLDQKGANIDATDIDYNRTPAMVALNSGALDAVEALTILGTNWDIPNEQGYSLRETLDNE